MTELKYLKDIAKSLDGIYKELHRMNTQPEMTLAEAFSQSVFGENVFEDKDKKESEEV